MLLLAGYSSQWSVAPGGTIDFKVSSQSSAEYHARLVRIVCADPNPEGPGNIEHDMSNIFSVSYPSRFQKVPMGSYGLVPIRNRLPHRNLYTLTVRIWPTLLSAGPQAILSLLGRDRQLLVELQINGDGQLSAVIESSENGFLEFTLDAPLRERNWYTVWANVDLENNKIQLGQQPLEPVIYAQDDASKIFHCKTLHSLDKATELLIAASRDGQRLNRFYNGKIENPRLLSNDTEASHTSQPSFSASESEVVASWDFSIDISSQKIRDVGKLELHGDLINCPARAMKGSNWSGAEMCWRHAPEEYGAIHFHDDDIADCNWETDFSFAVPVDFRSGMYSMRLECDEEVEDIPFYVRPLTGQPQSKICVIIPTFTYTVYTNQARSVDPDLYKKIVEERGLRPWNPDLITEYGLSTYNYHHDGSGIAYSTFLRPSLTMRPNYMTICRTYAGSGMRHLPADTHLFAWLEHLDQPFDTITDHDLHEHGAELLNPYQVVIAPTHPEYHTSETLDAISGYIKGGGKFMYLGGNGFYWKVAINKDLPGVVEIRRAEGGIRIWASEPGEYYNSLDGGYGGLWLRNGRPPQKLVGVGFTVQGDFEGTYYRKSMDLDKTYDWVFEGIDEQILGDFGLCGGGAAGFELDRADADLGTPENAVILARSENNPEHFVLVPEEILTHLSTRHGAPASELMHSDIVLFETENGGRVFSVGSITYCGSLPWNHFDNNISKLTQNVLNRFLSL